MIAVVALIVSGIIMDYKNSIFFSILNGENRVAFLISFIAYWISIGFEYKQILGLITGKSSLELSISLQVTFIAALSILAILLFWRDVGRIGFMYPDKKSFKFSDLIRVNVPFKGGRKTLKQR